MFDIVKLDGDEDCCAGLCNTELNALYSLICLRALKCAAAELETPLYGDVPRAELEGSGRELWFGDNPTPAIPDGKLILLPLAPLLPEAADFVPYKL